MSSKNTLLAVFGAIAIIILLIGGWFFITYNGLVAAEESVDA